MVYWVLYMLLSHLILQQSNEDGNYESYLLSQDSIALSARPETLTQTSLFIPSFISIFLPLFFFFIMEKALNMRSALLIHFFPFNYMYFIVIICL